MWAFEHKEIIYTSSAVKMTCTEVLEFERKSEMLKELWYYAMDTFRILEDNDWHE